MTNSFSQLDLEQLSSWMDGELAPEQELEVQKLVSENPAWAQAYRQLQELDKALDQWEVPETPANLSSKIIRNTKPKPFIVRMTRWAAPLATAAVIVLMVLVLQQGSNMQGKPGFKTSGQTTKNPRKMRTPSKRTYRVPTPQQQAMLLENYSRRMQFKQQWMAKYEWLLVVLGSFTPEELNELKKLPKDMVSKRIIQRRDELIKKGKLKFVPNPR